MKNRDFLIWLHERLVTKEKVLSLYYEENKDLIYNVVGSTGKYKDVCTWTAGIFKNKEKAEIFLEECQEYCKNGLERIPDEKTGQSYPRYFDQEYIKRSPDKHLEFDYTGVLYELETEEVKWK